jgi:hypothetical protein
VRIFPAITFIFGIAFVLFGFCLSLQIESTVGDIPIFLVVVGASSIGYGLGWVSRGMDE